MEEACPHYDASDARYTVQALSHTVKDLPDQLWSHWLSNIPRYHHFQRSAVTRKDGCRQLESSRYLQEASVFHGHQVLISKPQKLPCESTIQGECSSGLDRYRLQTTSGSAVERWTMRLVITEMHWELNTFCGVIETSDASQIRCQSVTTAFEGHLVDDNMYPLFTDSYTESSDSRTCQVQAQKLLLSQFTMFSNPMQIYENAVRSSDWLLMRLKEKEFVHRGNCATHLTISGYYTLALNRRTGEIEGFYLDPSTLNLQCLWLDFASLSKGAPTFNSFTVL